MMTASLETAFEMIAAQAARCRAMPGYAMIAKAIGAKSAASGELVVELLIASGRIQVETRGGQRFATVRTPGDATVSQTAGVHPAAGAMDQAEPGADDAGSEGPAPGDGGGEPVQHDAAAVAVEPPAAPGDVAVKVTIVAPPSAGSQFRRGIGQADPSDPLVIAQACAKAQAGSRPGSIAQSLGIGLAAVQAILDDAGIDYLTAGMIDPQAWHRAITAAAAAAGRPATQAYVDHPKAAAVSARWIEKWDYQQPEWFRRG